MVGEVFGCGPLRVRSEKYAGREAWFRFSGIDGTLQSPEDRMWPIVLLEGAKESCMNASGGNRKRDSVQISQGLLPQSLYCVLHYSALCSKTSDGEGEGWSNVYSYCLEDGHRTGHRGSVATYPPKGGQKEGRCRPPHRTRSNRVAGRQI